LQTLYHQSKIAKDKLGGRGNKKPLPPNESKGLVKKKRRDGNISYSLP
jgi:hypothetical protein